MRYGASCQRTIWVGCLAVTALTSTALEAAQPRWAPVPPTLEIEILDPNADPLGNPAVELTQPRCGEPGWLGVDIPPVVIVHRYYYTGDRTFQGPMMPGGPSIVVVTHPKTGERCYIEVQMLPGAPKVHYKGRSIEYDYGPNGITISFGFFGTPKVTYRNRVPWRRQANDAVSGVRSGTSRLIEESRLPQVTRAATEGTRNLVANTRNTVEDVGERLLAPAVGLVNATPLGSLFCSSPEEQAQRRRDEAVQRAAREAARANTFIPTLR